MNSRTTRWLVLLALGLGAFIYLFERRTDSTTERAERARLVLPLLNLPEVSALTLLRGTNLNLRLERRTTGWEFRAPLAYPAQNDSVERLLGAVAQLHWQGRVTTQDLLAQTNGLSAFGFAPPAAGIIVQQGDRRFDLRLGSPTPLGGQIYAQIVGGEGLYTVDAAILKALPATTNEWRDTALVQVGGRPYDRVMVRPITNGFEVVRNNSNRVWQMVRPLATRADNTRLSLLLQQLELARVTGFVSDDPAADLEGYGLQPPERELVLGQGANDMLVLQIGKSPTNAPDQLYVRRLAHSNVVLVARDRLSPWLGDFRGFCDRRMMVFKPEAVTRIEATDAESFALERLTNGAWEIVAPFRAAADSLLVLELLQHLTELEFLEFEREVAADFAPYGLAPPRRQYVLQTTVTNGVATPTNQVLAQVDIGNVTGFKYFARRTPENSVVTLADNQRLPRAAYELRDRRIWNIATNQIVSLTVQHRGSTRKLLRTGPMRWAPAPGSAETPPLNPVTLEEAAYRLGQLRADRWVARGTNEFARYGLDAADHQVTVEADEGGQTKTRVVQFGRLTLSGRSAYAAVELEGQPGPIVFECPLFIYEFVQSDLTVPAATAGAPP